MREAPLTWQECEQCQARFDELDPVMLCRVCGGLLEAHHTPPALSASALRQLFDGRLGAWAGGGPASGVWRFRELVLPGAAAESAVSYPEGNTPLVLSPIVGAWAGLDDLALKHEGLNPTGSFKDRGMTVALTQARRVGARAVAGASTGNTSASLAAYAALAGLPGFVLVPAGRVARGKLAQTVGYGAQVLAVRGDFDTCLQLLREHAEPLGLYLANSINPFRLEGQKSIIFELLSQRNWKAPDWIVLPGGNLGNTAAFGKALEEARAAGLIERLPRLAVVQAAGAAPFARSFAVGFEQRFQVEAETVATAIRIGNPASWGRAVRAIRATNGVVLNVSDGEILEAKGVVDRAGIGCEPASAAPVAGLRRLTDSGIVSAGQSAVVILTGHLLKDPEILLEGAPEKSIKELEASPAAFAAAIEAGSRTILP